MSNKAIDDFMSWLDSEIEEIEGYMDELYMLPADTRGLDTALTSRRSQLVALRGVENKAKSLGFITPKILGGSLEDAP